MSLQELIIGVIVLLTAFLGGTGTRLIINRIRLVKQMIKNETVNNALQGIENTIADVVMYFKTTAVDQLKEASSDGKLTKEEITEIVSSAKSRVYSIVKGDALDILHDVVDDVDAWIENKIEKHVELSKNK